MGWTELENLNEIMKRTIKEGGSTTVTFEEIDALHLELITGIDEAYRNSFRFDTNSRFYKNCKRQRKNEAKICQECPFRKWIEMKEQLKEQE